MRGHVPERALLPADPGITGCRETVLLPDSIAFVSTPAEVTRFYAWSEPQSATATPWWAFLTANVAHADTLRLHVLEARCGDVSAPTFSLQVLAEHDGYVMGIPSQAFFEPESSVGFSESHVALIGGDGKLDTAFVQVGCPGHSDWNCIAVRSLRSYRDSVSAAERADRLAEQAEVRAQADSDARARANRAAAIRRMGWSRATTQSVIAHRVGIGMTPKMVRMAWGEPDRVHRMTTATGTTEQWVYGVGSYVYFENDRVVVIQQ